MIRSNLLRGIESDRACTKVSGVLCKFYILEVYGTQ